MTKDNIGVCFNLLFLTHVIERGIGPSLCTRRRKGARMKEERGRRPQVKIVMAQFRGVWFRKAVRNLSIEEVMGS
jgi:hypothetical protein